MNITPTLSHVQLRKLLALKTIRTEEVEIKMGEGGREYPPPLPRAARRLLAFKTIATEEVELEMKEGRIEYHPNPISRAAQ